VRLIEIGETIALKQGRTPMLVLRWRTEPFCADAMDSSPNRQKPDLIAPQSTKLMNRICISNRPLDALSPQFNNTNRKAIDLQ
jgi:hypothetical protein